MSKNKNYNDDDFDSNEGSENGEYVAEEKVFETRWKCPSCDHDNAGRDMKCKSCAAPKDESAEYQVQAGSAEITDEKLLADAEAGEHWICAYCEKENRGTIKVCKFCNAEQNTRARKAPKNQPQTPPEPAKKGGCFIYIVIFLLFVGLIWWAFSPRTISTQVTAVSWEQSLNLHARTLVKKEDWSDKLPADAVDRVCSRRQHGTKQVVDHYETVTKYRSIKYKSGSHEECRTEMQNMKNGFAKERKICKNVDDYDTRQESYRDQQAVYRDEPVYEDFCKFTVFEWPITQTVTEKGTSNRDLKWPDLARLNAEKLKKAVECNTIKSRPDVNDCWSKDGVYVVTFIDPKTKKNPTYKPKTADEFVQFELGKKYKISLGGKDDMDATILKD